MRALARLVSIPLLALLMSMPVAFAQEDEAGFSQAELDQMLAPIALYPDVLLSQILMASTYPLEVVEAARWSGANPGLEGEAAVDAVADQDWDPSVKALVAFPRVLARMDEDLDWMRTLGDAFLYQEVQVMDTIQELRQRAYDAGNLNSTGNARVIREKEVIVIEPVHPHIVYVPYYDPYVIYGPWWWPAYVPVYWAPPHGVHLSVGFFWGSSVFVSTGFFFSSFDWYHRHVVIFHHHHYHHQPHFVAGKHVRYAGHPRWRHDPKHRHGVAYRHHSLQREFGTSTSSASGTAVTAQQTESSGQREKSRRGRDSNNERTRFTNRIGERRGDLTVQNRGRQSDRSDADRTVVRDRWRQRNGRDAGLTPGATPRRTQSGHRVTTADTARIDRTATRPDRRQGDTRQSRATGQRHDGFTRRMETGNTTTRGLSSDQMQSRRADANRVMIQRPRTQRSQSIGTSRATRTENRRSFVGNTSAGRQTAITPRVSTQPQAQHGTNSGISRPAKTESRAAFAGKSSSRQSVPGISTVMNRGNSDVSAGGGRRSFTASSGDRSSFSRGGMPTSSSRWSGRGAGFARSR